MSKGAGQLVLEAKEDSGQWSFLAFVSARPSVYKQRAKRYADKIGDTVRVVDPRSDAVLYQTDL